MTQWCVFSLVCFRKMKQRKVLFFLADGLSDYKTLADQTPLTAAKMKTAAKLMETGVFGLVDPLSPGYTCGSDTAHLALFGFHPSTNYCGRATLEALGCDAPVQTDDLVFKCSFGLLDEDDVVLQRGLKLQQKVSEAEWRRLFRLLNTELETAFSAETVKVVLWHAGGFRSVMFVRGLSSTHNKVCPGKGNTDPLLSGTCLSARFVHPPADICECERTVFSALRLINFCVNEHSTAKLLLGQKRRLVYLNRSASYVYTTPQTFRERTGLTAAMVSTTPVVRGVGKLLQMSVFRSLSELTAVAFHSDFDFVFVHSKSPDDCAHACDPVAKRDALVVLDDEIQRVVEEVRLKVFYSDDFRIVFTGDHTTSSQSGRHECEPVPFATASYRNYAAASGELAVFDEQLGTKSAGRVAMCDLLELLYLS